MTLVFEIALGVALGIVLARHLHTIWKPALIIFLYVAILAGIAWRCFIASWNEYNHYLLIGTFVLSVWALGRDMIEWVQEVRQKQNAEDSR